MGRGQGQGRPGPEAGVPVPGKRKQALTPEHKRLDMSLDTFHIY